MATTIGENGIHEIEVESQSDAIKGDSITVEYHPIGGGSVTTGDSVIGVESGSVMAFTTDFEGKAIGPGYYEVEFVRDDQSVKRQLGIEGEDSNRIQVEVTDAEAI